MDMHKRIKQARKAAGFNKSELARSLDVTPTSCSSWELPPENRNNSRPSIDNLGRLALILNVRFEWLATGRGPMPLTTPGNEQLSLPQSESDKAKSLLGLYRSLSAEQRGTVLDFLKLVSGKSSKPRKTRPLVKKKARQQASPPS